MDTKSVFLVLSGIAVGATGAYTGSDLTARAGVAETKPYIQPQGIAGPALQSQIESGLALQAYQHANSQLGVTLPTANGACPIEHIHLRCETVDAARQWEWEYKTLPLNWTAVPAEPE